MIALVRIADDAVLKVWDIPEFKLRISPVEVGWEGGGELTYEPLEIKDGEGDDARVRIRQIGKTGPARFRFLAVERAAVPEGHDVIETSYRVERGVVVESVTTKPIELPPPVPPAERLLASTGLTVDELKELLGLPVVRGGAGVR
jgi:hypothetical protein